MKRKRGISRLRLSGKKELAKMHRKDGKMEHVILNEKREKSLKKFLVDKLPFEFETKEQFDFCMSQPVGQEWAGIKNFKNNVKPVVVANLGKSILPIGTQRIPKTKFV